jgi:hypothetical protein
MAQGGPRVVTTHAEADSRDKVSCMKFKAHVQTNLSTQTPDHQHYAPEATLGYLELPNPDLAP